MKKYSVREITEDVKSYLRPITPPNKDVSEAIRKILKKKRYKDEDDKTAYSKTKHSRLKYTYFFKN